MQYTIKFIKKKNIYIYIYIYISALFYFLNALYKRSIYFICKI